MIKFKEVELPKWYSIDWTGAKSGLGFEMSVHEINKDALDWIKRQAAKRGVILSVSKSADGGSYVFFVKESRMDLYGEIYAAIAAAGSDGVLWSYMVKNPPYSKHSRKNLDALLSDLESQGYIKGEMYTSPQGGRPTRRYFVSEQTVDGE